MMNKKDGVITIYLALTLGIILALIVTTIEAARMNAAKTYVNRVLDTSMKSALCDYYLPLYERYHIFGLHLDGTTKDDQQSVLIDNINQRAKDHLDTGKGDSILPYLLNGTNQSFRMCNPKVEDMKLSNMVYLTDQEGRFMRNQALAYTKYSAPVDLLEKLLKAVGAMKETQVATGVISEKMSIEKDLAAIDQKTLQLMELIDGIETNECGIEQSSFLKSLSVTDFYVKRLVTDTPTQENVGINHAEIFEALESFYVKIREEYKRMRDDGAQIYESAQAYLVTDKFGNESYEFDNQQQMEDLDELIDTYKTLDQMSLDLFTSINENINQSLEIIQQIEQEKKAAADRYTSYKVNLEDKREEIGKELYTELSSSDEDILAYTDASSNHIGLIYDIKQMKETLLYNQGVLNQIINREFVPFSIQPKEYQAWCVNLTELETILCGYSLKGLSFDYSEVELEECDYRVFGIIGGIACSGIFSSIMDSKTEISKAKLTGVSLPSDHPKELMEGQVADNLEEINKMYLEIGGLNFGDMGISMDEMSKSAYDLCESLLYIAYLNEHTTNFTSKDYEVGQVLKYEQEYLLFGKLKDRSNIEEFATRMVMIRTAFNMISVLTDQEKVSKAEETAQIMAWTGLHFLVSMTKYLILFYWAFSEARVEVAALFKEKSIPIYTTHQDFVVGYSDLFGLTTNKVVKMAESYDAKTFLKLDYTEYLLLNLIFVGEQDKIYRMMDLIQENLRYEYEDSFRMKNCLFSFTCEAYSTMPQKFFFLPYFQKGNIGIEGYQLHSKLSVTY